MNWREGHKGFLYTELEGCRGWEGLGGSYTEMEGDTGDLCNELRRSRASSYTELKSGGGGGQGILIINREGLGGFLY